MKRTSGGGEIGALRLGDTGAEEGGLRRLGHRGVQGQSLDGGGLARGTSLLEGCGAHQQELKKNKNE